MPDHSTVNPIDQQEKDALQGPPPSGKKPFNIKKELSGWFFSILFAVILYLIISSFLFVLVRVDGSSMANTLHHKEMVFVTKLDYLFSDPDRQDVVICHYPNRKEFFVKRVIGLPGDVIEIQENLLSGQNMVLINGEVLQEPYLTSSLNRMPSKTMAPVTLGEEEYFVMGDNRDHSNDSRNLSLVGPISRKSIVGHVRFVFFPFNAWKGIS